MSVLFKHTWKIVFFLNKLKLAGASTALVTVTIVWVVSPGCSQSAQNGATLGHGMWAFPLLFWKGIITDYTKTFHWLFKCCIFCLSAGHGRLSDTEMLFSLYWRRFFSIKGLFLPLIFFFLTLKTFLARVSKPCKHMCFVMFHISKGKEWDPLNIFSKHLNWVTNYFIFHVCEYFANEWVCYP